MDDIVIDFGTDGIVDYVQLPDGSETLLAIVAGPSETYWKPYKRDERYYDEDAARAAGLNPGSDRHDIYTVAVLSRDTLTYDFMLLDVSGRLRKALARAKVRLGNLYRVTRRGKGSETTYTVELVDESRGGNGLTEAQQAWADFLAS